MSINWSEKTIMVTGGTGSFGKKFTEMVLRKHPPKKLIIFSRDELKQHEMRVAGFDHPCLRYFIGDIRDKNRLERAMNGVDIVVHAAAMKQVPTCEYNPSEAVKTNIHGSQNIIDAAVDCGVERVLAISTDKAVNPINLYGATKLCAEKLFVQGNYYSGAEGTKFSCSRYGNVIGSRGSVVPIFLEQRKAGVMTVTDKEMTRFWLSLDDGVSFVLECLENMQGGELFIPKIPSMRVEDMARAIGPECEIRFTGIRPGEKMHESLISSDESHMVLELDRMFIVQPSLPWWNASGWAGGRKVKPGMEYRSDNNSVWLDRSGLLEILRQCGFTTDGQNSVSVSNDTEPDTALSDSYIEEASEIFHCDWSSPEAVALNEGTRA